MATMLKQDSNIQPAYTGPIFDCDTHLYEVEDSWSRYLPAEYRDRWSVRFRTGEDGQYALYVGDKKVHVSSEIYTEDGRVPPPGKLHEWLRAMKEGNENVDMRIPRTPDMYERDARIAKMDEFGVEGAILFVGSMIASISYLDESIPAYEVTQAYNRWFLEDWGFAYKNRIFATPLLLLEDLDRAVEQAKWAVENGARAVLIPMGPINGRSPADTYFDPVWSILNEAGVGIVFHVSEAIYMKHHMNVWGEKVQQSRVRQTAFVWMHGYSERPVVETISSFIFWNFFARFPKIKLMSAENGAEWVPSMLIKMDKCRGMAKNGFWPAGQLKDRPSRIFKQHVSVVAYPEDDLKSIIEQTGSSEYLVMGSDYPHQEGVERPALFAEEACGGLDGDTVRQIMYENGKRFIFG
ncbi:MULTISPECIES: amidohydrolase family protein [unclassified Sphingobium]|uniref:amidohydrolase family protein n=1 Tax=unclassified Sphingobium TaxID=2611147 RepID=UPI000D155933|nr:MULTISPECIES: amidohydrolase family protein [unclassified Sphingobium]MBG6120142.1 putative TIM-barrel fold metal-dependent hydrolase [Sphingobium sp. JAI105]PSO12821.1 amidohydrolase [Sphingobium sp. AEW4]TWD05657.1 putative TIM-barrel fold metal-dependent hydrolase [Sphingobium sp. AEW010]TWD23210.1 putative TIM-barrel fold metal-dependent hydrolase [Sphingobium sp. AEW013]TWD25070.1 putative TIM-barrel fold metal-dependent hydrolase [Sphingobium sp. AEW001]